MKRLRICMLVFTVVVMISCDIIYQINGVVVDSETGLPIEGVMVKRADCAIDSLNPLPAEWAWDKTGGIDWDMGLYGKYTDSHGNFSFTFMTGSLIGYPKHSFSFEKEGYSVFTKKYKGYVGSDTITVALKRKE